MSETKNKLERSEKDFEKLKRRTGKEIEAKVASISEENQKIYQELEEKMTSKVASMIEEKQGIEKECNKFKKQKEEAQKTCEELASKLSKAYSEMEKLKKFQYTCKGLWLVNGVIMMNYAFVVNLLANGWRTEYRMLNLGNSLPYVF